MNFSATKPLLRQGLQTMVAKQLIKKPKVMGNKRKQG